MFIRSTTDPITLNDVTDLESHPSLYEGDGTNGLEIHFESEATKQAYLAIQLADHKIVEGSDSEEYVAEG